MTNVEELSDWLAICDLKARYCRLLDTKDWDGWRELFTKDYELDVSQETGMAPIKGRDAALEMILSNIRTTTTVHQVHSPEIRLDGDEAHAIWAMHERLIFGPADRRSPDTATIMNGSFGRMGDGRSRR